MLRVTIELLPVGRESGKRVIATADIARVSGGALADYRVALEDAVLGEVGARVVVRSYCHVRRLLRGSAKDVLDALAVPFAVLLAHTCGCIPYKRGLT
ncbi:hypothetical protein [Paraburkholderia sediminicola]|uniref:hypothetical protein n=1 Tax=Paraburkholderia sediminicola TaxID=458836 RepID=UPI0038BD2599